MYDIYWHFVVWVVGIKIIFETFESPRKFLSLLFLRENAINLLLAKRETW